MDPRRHGKLPLSSHASEAKERDDAVDEVDAYASSWCTDTDMSAMVSALAQVMGTANQNPHMAQSNPFPVSTSVVKEEPHLHPSQPLQDQGVC